MTEEKYNCRICGTEITKDQYEDHDELCEFCEDNEEMDEDEDFDRSIAAYKMSTPTVRSERNIASRTCPDRSSRALRDNVAVNRRKLRHFALGCPTCLTMRV